MLSWLYQKTLPRGLSSAFLLPKGIDDSYETCNDLAKGIPDAQLMNALKEDKLFTRNDDGELVTLSGTPIDEL